MIKDEHVAELFAANLRRCRRAAGLSQEELAVRASLHRTAIGHFERQSRLPHLTSFVKVSASLGVSPLELLEGIHWKPGETLSGRFTREDES